jgi:hypothetical protein
MFSCTLWFSNVLDKKHDINKLVWVGDLGYRPNFGNTLITNRLQIILDSNSLDIQNCIVSYLLLGSV